MFRFIPSSFLFSDGGMRQEIVFHIFLLIIIKFSNSFHNSVSNIDKNLIRARSSLHGRSCGIDLGTTYSLVSVIEKGKPILLPIDGSNLLPSVVSYPDSKTVLVGRPALDARPQYPENTFSSIKRIIGRKLDDAMKSGDNYLFGKRLRSIKAEDNEEYCGVYCSSLKKVLLPEQISADILRRLIKRAENYYHGEKVTNAVITVPEYFTSAQRDATIRAGKLAGLDKIKVLGEPEAAAIAYGLRQKSPQLVLVFDLGGGTFDVSVLEVGAGLVEVISTNGDNHLGGDDFDKAIVDWILTRSKCISKQAEQHIRSNIALFNKVKDAATIAKLQLTEQMKTRIYLPSIYINENIDIELSRMKFHELVKPLLQRFLRPIREVCLMSGVNLPGDSGKTAPDPVREKEKLSKEDIDVYDCSMKTIEALKKYQVEGKKRFRERRDQQHTLRKEMKRLRAVNPKINYFPVGAPLGDVILVGGASRMVCVINIVKALTGIDPKRHLHPDEAVALGAGIYAGTIDGTVEGLDIISPWQAAMLRFMNDLKSKGSLPPELEMPSPSPTPTYESLLEASKYEGSVQKRSILRSRKKKE